MRRASIAFYLKKRRRQQECHKGKEHNKGHNGDHGVAGNASKYKKASLKVKEDKTNSTQDRNYN